MLRVYQQNKLYKIRTSKNRAATRPNEREVYFVVCKIKILLS